MSGEAAVHPRYWPTTKFVGTMEQRERAAKLGVSVEEMLAKGEANVERVPALPGNPVVPIYIRQSDAQGMALQADGFTPKLVDSTCRVMGRPVQLGPVQAGRAKVAVLVSSFNRDELLELGLQSLAACMDGHVDGELLGQRISGMGDALARVIVLNDGKPDGPTADITRQLGFEYLATRTNKSFQGNGPDGWRVPGFAFNRGFQFVKDWQPDVLVLTCAEMFHLDHDALAQLASAVCDDGMLMTSPQGRDDGKSMLLDFLKGYGNSEQTDKLDGLYQNLDMLNVQLPFCLAMRASKFNEIGGYDQALTGIAYDDDDLVWRLRQAGLAFKPTHTRMAHLFHPRNHGGGLDQKTYMDLMTYNRERYLSRREWPIRNHGVNWGQG